MEAKTNLLVGSSDEEAAVAATALEPSDEMLESLAAARGGPLTQQMVNSCYSRTYCS